MNIVASLIREVKFELNLECSLGYLFLELWYSEKFTLETKYNKRGQTMRQFLFK